MRRRIGICLLMLALAGPLSAEAPDASLRPLPRADSPADPTSDAADPVAVAIQVAGFPDLPPPGLGRAVGPAEDAELPPATVAGAIDPRPALRPAEAPDAAPEPATPRTAEVIVGASSLAPRASSRPIRRATGTPSPPSAQTEIAANATRVEAEGTRQIIERRGLFGTTQRVIEVPAFAGETALAALVSPRPARRPDGLEARVRAAATRTTPARVTQPGRRGQLCGSPGLVGERIDPIVGRISGCGIAEPIRLREVDGVALTTPATINCTTAQALQTWLGQAQGIVGRTGGGIENLRVVASYSCRTRNNQAGARLSEHSTGNGIDIAGIGLVNGQELTVLGGWRDRTAGPILQRLHQAACGPFGTVLGPNSDRHHQDHFHFDVADYRSGPYCR